jgi:hypothetical protein
VYVSCQQGRWKTVRGGPARKDPRRALASICDAQLCATWCEKDSYAVAVVGLIEPIHLHDRPEGHLTHAWPLVVDVPHYGVDRLGSLLVGEGESLIHVRFHFGERAPAIVCRSSPFSIRSVARSIRTSRVNSGISHPSQTARAANRWRPPEQLRRSSVAALWESFGIRSPSVLILAFYFEQSRSQVLVFVSTMFAGVNFTVAVGA